MERWAVLTLRIVIAIALVGSLVVQLVIVPLMWSDTAEAPTGVRVSMAVIVVLGIACLQIIAVCVWKLLTMVSHGTVFSVAAFRYVDVVIGAIAVGALLIFGVAVVARTANLGSEGDEVAPGIVGLICGLALVAAGVAIVVYVLRVLLAQAVALDSQTRQLKSELDGVI